MIESQKEISFEESGLENIHKLNSWKYYVRIRQADKRFSNLKKQKSLREEVIELRKSVEILLESQGKRSIVKSKSQGELVYEELQEELEKKYFGKTVAIDVLEKKVAGIGNSIEEAHDDAMTRTDAKKFYFRKVGQTQPISL